MDVLVTCPSQRDRKALAAIDGYRFHLLDAKLNPPPGWFSDPSDLSMTLAAGSSAVTEFRIVMGLPFVPNTWPPYMPQITVHDGAIVVSLSASADGERLKVVSSKEYLLKDALCLLPGEPLCH